MGKYIIYDEMVGIMGTKKVYHKRKQSTHGIDVINKHIADSKEAAVKKAEETVDADKVKLGVDENYQPNTRKMLRKHNDLW